MDIEIMKGVAGAFFTKAQTYTAMRSYRNSSNNMIALVFSFSNPKPQTPKP